MNITEHKARIIAEKALTDIGFGTNYLTAPNSKFFEDGGSSILVKGIPIWLVSFTLDTKIFGAHPPLKVFVAVKDADGLAHHVTLKSGFDLLGYDPESDKYFKKPRPQPK